MHDRESIAAAVQTVLAECFSRRCLTLDEAVRLATRAEKAAKALSVPVVIAVADAGGGLMLMHRMDGSLPASVDIAVNKAFSAAAFRLPTHELGALAQPGNALYGVQFTNQGRVLLFGGGFPCERDGVVLGAVGISGGTVDQDMRIARHALHGFYEEAGFALAGGKEHE